MTNNNQEIILEVVTDRITYGGAVIATITKDSILDNKYETLIGKKIFIFGALPEERVLAKITVNKSKFCEGIATKIITSSPHRIKYFDENYCDTSPLQIYDFKYENVIKQHLIDDAFKLHNIDLFDYSNSTNIKTDYKDYYYRNKNHYHFINYNGRIDFATMQRSTNILLKCSSFSLVDKNVDRYASKILNHLNSTEYTEFNMFFHSLIVKSNYPSTNIKSQLVVTNKQIPKNVLSKLNVDEISIYNSKNKTIKPFFSNNSTQISQKIRDLLFNYDINSFFQINISLFEQFVEDLIKQSKAIKFTKIVDLYCGVGVIGISLAKEFQNSQLTLVDIDQSNIKYAKINAQKNGIDAIIKKSNAKDINLSLDSQTLVIVDPPRSGLDKTLINTIRQTKPYAIAYLSCNPVTQARDYAKLSDLYEIKYTQSYNFFPRTPHIENFILLTSKD